MQFHRRLGSLCILYLRFIFKSREKAPNQMPTNISNLRQLLINAPWQDADSFPECHLLVHGFVPALLYHMSSDNDVHPIGRFWPCAELERLAGTERVTDADDSPIVRSVSMLLPMVERIRMRHA